MAVKLMRFAEGQKQMLNSLRQNFSQDAEGSFTNFETVLEGLTTRDSDNKKLVLDQVISVAVSMELFFHPSANILNVHS